MDLQEERSELMQPRKNVVEIFSTFLRLEDDRPAGWIADVRLWRRMLALHETLIDRSDSLWVLYWHEVWRSDGNSGGTSGAEAHLSAYLQETCYWVARRMATNQRNVGWLADFFQIAIVRVPKILRYFKPEYRSSLKKYAELGFENSLKDWLRLQQQVEICSDWALLRRLSRKRLRQSLQQAGWNAETIFQYTLAWECYQELTATTLPTALPVENPQGRPMDSTWTAIAKAYNADRFSQIAPGTPSATPAQLEQWLLTCAQSVRQFLKPAVVSADTPLSDQTSGRPLDLIADLNPSLMEQLVKQEEDIVRSQQMKQLQAVLVEAIASLSEPEKALLQDYYRDQMIQSDMAKKLGIQQYQVSRQLERVRRSLLKQIILWVQENLHTSPTPSVVDAMGHSLDLWLKDYGRTEV
jgi:RNA polymerase sigma factor (sigma-70 family)